MTVLAGGASGSMLLDQLRLGEVVQLVVDIGDGAPTSSIEEALRRTLADPKLELLLWSTDQAEFLDVEGVPYEPRVNDQTMTHLKSTASCWERSSTTETTRQNKFAPPAQPSV